MNKEHCVANVHQRPSCVHQKFGIVAAAASTIHAGRQANEHLRNLQGGDDLRNSCGHSERMDKNNRQLKGCLPIDLGTHDTVVRVHNRVHEEVHHGEPIASTDIGDEASPAVDESEGMVVPVKKNDWSLAKDEEACINEFGELAEAEKENPRSVLPKS